jgi:hypothetical protein
LYKKMHRYLYIYALLLGAAASGCGAINPLQVSSGRPDGTTERYYLTNAFSGSVAAAEQRLGIFVVGTATMGGAGSLEVSLYNLSSQTMNVELLRLAAFGQPINISSEQRMLRVAARSRLRTRMGGFAMSSYAPEWTVVLTLSVDSSRVQCTLTLNRARAETYIEAVASDARAPSSADVFERLPDPTLQGTAASGTAACRGV